MKFKIHTIKFFKKTKPLNIHFLTLLVISANFVSCSLDFPIEDEITGLDAIDNVAIADETLAGVYVAYPKNKINFSKLADDFYPNHTIFDNPTDYQFYNWNEMEIQIFSNSLWNDYYSTITKANMLLSRVSEIKTETSKKTKELQQIKGQTLCLKALCYFDLIQIYSEPYSKETRNNLGIVLKDKVAFEKLPRSTLEESYKETERLLLEAISVFSDEEKTSYRFSKKGAKTVLAKLYLNWGKHTKVITLCDEVIPFKSINDNSFNEIWKDLENTVGRNDKIISETILAMEETYSYFTEIYDKQANENEYYLNPNIVYQDNDTRKETSIIKEEFRNADNSTEEVNYLGKFRKEITDTDDKSIPILRVAELYFIKAESLYHLSKENEAKTVINLFLSLRNTQEINTTGTSFFNDLLKEKQKEFVGEGVRYFDMKRNKLVLDRVSSITNKFTFKISNTDYRWQFPVSEIEMKYNNNMINNKGY